MKRSESLNLRTRLGYNQNKDIYYALLYIAVLFLVTRLVLGMIGYIAQKNIYNYFPDSQGYLHVKNLATHHTALNIWHNFDSGWYMSIAENGYAQNLLSLNFFPFFPVLTRLFSALIMGHLFVTGLFISNVCFVLAAIYMYKLFQLDYDGNTSKRAIKYLFLLPAAFVFSGFMTESLFLLLALATIYYSRNGRWWLVGILGALLSLTRSNGVFILVPVLIEFIIYCKDNNWNLKYLLRAFWLALIPAGLGIYMLYNYKLTANPIYFTFTQKNWALVPTSPEWIPQALFSGGYNSLVIVTLLTSLILLIAFRKKIRISYIVYAVIVLLLPFVYGPQVIHSLLRYMLVAFPVPLTLALLTKNRVSDELLTIGLALFQGFLMAAWILGWTALLV